MFILSPYTFSLAACLFTSIKILFLEKLLNFALKYLMLFHFLSGEKKINKKTEEAYEVNLKL